MTAYFRESSTGTLHGLQGTGATVLRPLEVAIDRVARPFRDVYGYFDALFEAKGESERLRAELVRLRELVIQNGSARDRADRLARILKFRSGPDYPRDYSSVAASVIVQGAGQFDKGVVISAGSNDGIRRRDPVVNEDGNLVGNVSLVTARTARVTLLTDDANAVSAFDLNTKAQGLVRTGQSDSLILDHVGKDEAVQVDDLVVTAGSQASGKLPSIYPGYIKIGTVTSEGQADTDLYKRVQIEPLVDFDALGDVLVLVRKERGRRP